MITFTEGKVGSGKTYDSVYQILIALARGKMVLTNIELNEEECMRALLDRFGKRYKTFPAQFLEEDTLEHVYTEIPYGDGRESTTLVVIDEAHNYYNSRDWAKLDPMLRKWLTNSRKYGADLILISQHNAAVDANFRRNGSFFYRIKNLNDYKLPLIGSLSRYMKVKLDSQSLVDSWSLRKYEPWIFKCYESTAFLDEATRKLAENAPRVSAELFEEYESPVKTAFFFFRGLRRLRQGPVADGKSQSEGSDSDA